MSSTFWPLRVLLHMKLDGDPSLDDPHGMLFVGLDVIGDYLTEVNVTSPTCVRELDAQFGLNIAGQLFDAIERRLAAKMRKTRL